MFNFVSIHNTMISAPYFAMTIINVFKQPDNDEQNWPF